MCAWLYFMLLWWMLLLLLLLLSVAVFLLFILIKNHKEFSSQVVGSSFIGMSLVFANTSLCLSHLPIALCLRQLPRVWESWRRMQGSWRSERGVVTRWGVTPCSGYVKRTVLYYFYCKVHIPWFGIQYMKTETNNDAENNNRNYNFRNYNLVMHFKVIVKNDTTQALYFH